MTLDGGCISITALSPLTARQHPPILPFLLAYMSGLCGFFPATRHFIAPGLLPLGLFLFALFLTHRKTRESIIVLFLAGFGYLVPALPDLTRPSNHILNHIQEGRTTVVLRKIIFVPTRSCRSNVLPAGAGIFGHALHPRNRDGASEHL